MLTPDEARRLLDSRSVRRQSFWDKERLKLRGSLAPLVCNIMRLADGVTSGNGLAPPEVDGDWRQVANALVRKLSPLRGRHAKGTHA